MDLSQCLGLLLSLGIFTLILEAASSYKHWNLSMKMQCVFYNTQTEAWIYLSTKWAGFIVMNFHI